MPRLRDRIDDWAYRHRRALAVVIAIVLGLLMIWRVYQDLDRALAQTPEPAIVTNVSIRWDRDRLLLDWQGRGYVCAKLIGGDRLATYVENGCAYDEARLILPTTGVDSDYAPQLRDAIELRDGGGVIVVVPIPPRVVLPIVVAATP